MIKSQVWDVVSLTLPVAEFANGTPLTNSHSPSNGVWGFTNATVKEVQINLEDNSVTITLRSRSYA